MQLGIRNHINQDILEAINAFLEKETYFREVLKRVQKQMVSSGSSNQSRAQSHFFPHLVVVPLFFSHLFEEIASFATRRRPMDVDESARQKHFIIVFLT